MQVSLRGIVELPSSGSEHPKKAVKRFNLANVFALCKRGLFNLKSARSVRGGADGTETFLGDENRKKVSVMLLRTSTLQFKIH